MAVMTTAWRRPYYFEPVLGSWAQAAGSGDLRQFAIAIGPTDRYDAQMALITRMRPRFRTGLDVMMQSDAAIRGNGPHRAIAEAASAVFADPAVKFLVFGEEDVMVSGDVLSYMRWAAARFAGDAGVLAVLAHSAGGQGWDRQEPADDADASQDTARLLPYFNPWCWGTWRDRWEQILEPEWDWDCTSGGVMDSGYDWNIHSRVLPRHKMTCVVPDASRSQNIGQFEGWASRPEHFPVMQAASFRRERGPVEYRLVCGDDVLRQVYQEVR